jgi:hypothetical protein
MRLAAHAGDIDVPKRVGECVALFVADPARVEAYVAGVDPTLALFDVPDPAPLYAALSPSELVAIKRAADQFEQTLLPYLPPPLGTVTLLQLSCLTADQGELKEGMVVLVRKSDVVIEQYAFPFVRVDRRNGARALALPARPAPPKLGIHANANGPRVAQEVIGAVMAVTPFFPPPFGAAATGVLAVVNLIIGLAAPEAPAGPSPLDIATQSIEKYIADLTLSKWAGDLKSTFDEFTNTANSQKESIDSLSAINGGVQYLRDMLKDRWTPDLVTTNGEVYDHLKTCSVTDFSSTLCLLTSGLTSELILYHAQIAIAAVDASIQYRHQDLEGYRNAAALVSTLAGAAAEDVGASDSGDWTEEQITKGMASSSYLPKIEAWMAKVTKDRLAQISGLTRFQREYVNNGPYFDIGWTFTDSGTSGDQGALANSVHDTEGEHCCDDRVEHKDVAEQKLAAYRAAIAKQVDDGFAPHRQVMASWTTYIANLLALLPPDVPPVPHVSLAPPGGAGTPSGDWVSGDAVRYSLMARGTKGPSPASDWSEPLTIGATVGAVLGGITHVDGAVVIVVLRQIRRHDSAEWSDAKQIAALAAPFPATYSDVSTGGDPWQ